MRYSGRRGAPTGIIETPAALVSAETSTASARTGGAELGHARSGDILPRYPTRDEEPNETLFMQRAVGSRSSGPAAFRSAKKRWTSFGSRRFLIATSPCCKAVQPVAYTRKRYPARFVEPESTISASPVVTGTRRYSAGGAGEAAGIGPYVGMAARTSASSMS